MLDAYSSIGMPLFYRHWSFGKHFARTRPCTARAGGPRLRDRHQFRPLHQLHHGGELRDDAGAGDRARRLRPQPLLQEQLPVPAVDRCRRHPRLSRLRQGLRRRLRGALRPGRGRAAARRRARADEPGRSPLSAQASARSALRGTARARSGDGTRSRSTTISGAPCRAPSGKVRDRVNDEIRRRIARAAAGEHPLLPREDRAAAAALAARDPAHRAPHRAVLLSAAPDQGDERGLRHLLPLPDHEPRCTSAARSPTAPCWSSCTPTPTSSSSRSSTTSISAASTPMRWASP